jgi:hypothetical protein
MIIKNNNKIITTIACLISMVVILATALIMNACTKKESVVGNNKESSKESIYKKESTEIHIKSRDEFWKTFRRATLENDMKTITAMTKFPFVAQYSYGPDTAFAHDIKEFPVVFDALLQLERKGFGLPKSTYEIIRQKEKIGQKEKNEFKVGVFKFSKVQGSWFLTGAYAPDCPNIIVTGPSGTPQQSFQDFWSKFRQAVLSNDKTAIASMTAFLFISYGPTDDFPTYVHNKDEFLQIIDSLLDSDSNSRNKKESMREFIIRNKTFEEAIANDKDGNGAGESGFGTHRFSFTKIYGKFYFTSAVRAYTPEK